MHELVKILIVEDSPDDLLLLVRELKKADFDLEYQRVDTLSDLSKELKDRSWDLIISDYNLLGFSALDALHVHQKTGLELPFIIVSGVVGEDAAVEAMKAGAHDYLMKSNLTRLVPAIERELQKAEVRKENKLMEAKILNYQNQLRIFASELTLTEERARRRIATDLHDRIGQTLAMSKIKLKSFKNSTLCRRDNDLLDSIIEMIGQTIQDTRTLTFEISPTILYELGFEAAIEWLIETVPMQYGINAKINDDMHPKPLGDDVRIFLFQAVRELLFNIIKHSQAKNVTVNLARGAKKIIIEVIDDGVGFDPDLIQNSFDRTGGFGLFSIKERLSYMGGKIIIESNSQGTVVLLTGPLKDEF